MPRFAANLNLQFNEVPMLERYGRAAAAGFTQAWATALKKLSKFRGSYWAPNK